MRRADDVPLHRLAELRRRIAMLQAPACGMAHERIVAGPDGRPVPNPASPSGYRRPGICPAERRARHIGCSHTTARLILRQAIELLGDGHADLLAELSRLENAVSLLDHRRYDAESRRADAVSAGSDPRAAEREIAALVAEHRDHVDAAARLRDEVLTRVDRVVARDAALSGGIRAGE